MKRIKLHQVILILIILLLVTIGSGIGYYIYLTAPKKVFAIPPDVSLPERIKTSLGSELILVPSRVYKIGYQGKDQSEPYYANGDLGPPENVLLSPYYIGKTEVTRAEYRMFLVDTGLKEKHGATFDYSSDRHSVNHDNGYTPSDDFPVSYLTYYDAVAFCDWLSKRDGIHYRLPTEAEWEVAASAGDTNLLYWWGDEFDNQYGNQSPDDQPKYKIFNAFWLPGAYPANPWGIYDVIGNAYEWTSTKWRNLQKSKGSTWTRDDFVSQYDINPEVQVNPNGPHKGIHHIAKAGGLCMISQDIAFHPQEPRAGFRIVCEVDSTFLEALKSNSELVVEPYFNDGLDPTFKSPDVVDHDRALMLPGEVPLYLKSLPAGEVLVGSSPEKQKQIWDPDFPTVINTLKRYEIWESPSTTFVIPYEFEVGCFEVTQRQFQAIMETNPSEFLDPDKPVMNVRRHGALEFCRLLTAYARENGQLETNEEVRLPFEWEWEYAARAGSTGDWCFGDDVNQLRDYAWYDVVGGPRRVGLKKPNAWGLYDVHGNVWEYCTNGLFEYPDGTINDPLNKIRLGWLGISQENTDYGELMLRGGAWNFKDHRTRCAARYNIYPTVISKLTLYVDDFLGFRVVIANIDEPKRRELKK